MTNTMDTYLQPTTEFVNKQDQTLKYNVQEALQNYFAKIGDTFINNLYEIVLNEVEEPLLKAVMQYTRGNQSKASILLGLSRGTLRKKLKIYGMLD
jgi:Fis family transcriptional regulator